MSRFFKHSFAIRPPSLPGRRLPPRDTGPRTPAELATRDEIARLEAAFLTL